MDYGAVGASRFARTRGRINGSFSRGINYPSPFFDIGHTYLPTTVKQMFRWCRYYFLVHPLINSVVFKMSLYPITDLVFNSDDEHQKDLWSNMLEDHLRYRSFMGELGLDFYTYGNGLVSIFYPFKKKLKCKSCGNVRPAKDSKYYFRNYQFFWHCPRCGHHGPAEVFDDYIKSSKGIRLLRWNPEDVDIRYNDLTGDYAYYYDIPVQLKNDIIMGKKSVVEEVPQIFVEALKKRKAIVFNKDNIYHFKRPTLAGKDRGWGVPLLLPVLKDAYYLQILKKSQEAVALEHIVPLRVLFPQAGSATSDPYCVSLDTLIETREGLRPAAEVCVGDYLKSHTGRWRKVEALADRSISDEEEVYKFTISGMTAFPFEISQEHPLLCSKRPSGFRGYNSLEEPDWVEAKDVVEGDFVCYPVRRAQWANLELDLANFCPKRAATCEFIYRRLNQTAANIYEYFEQNGVPTFGHGELKKFLTDAGWGLSDYENAKSTFTQQESVDRRRRYISVTEDLAYLIGIFAAEGSRAGSLATMGLHTSETYIMDSIDLCVERLGFRPCSRSTQGNSTTITVNDVFLAALLVNSCGEGSVNKRLPRFITEAPGPIAMTAVRAVITGDGCAFSTSTVRTGLKTTSPQLAIDVRGILLSEGFIPTVQKAIPREDEIAKLPYYQVNLNGSQSDLFEGVVSSRKFPFSRCGFIRDGYVYLRVSKREVVKYVDVVRGFQMLGDKSFCVAGVATHNSSINLGDWKDQISEEIKRWRFDNNYIPILPLPIGNQTIGGNGRAMLLGQEIRVWSEHIVVGMGVPQELIFGGLSYCMDLDSYLFTSDGMIPMGDLVPEKEDSFKKPSKDIRVPTHKNLQSVEMVHNSGMKKAARLRTRLGLDHSPSHDHRFRVLNSDLSLSWKKASELQPGDHVAVKPGQRVWAKTPFDLASVVDDVEDSGKNVAGLRRDTSQRYPVKIPAQMSDELARILGYLVSEGSCADERRIGFGQKSEEIMNDFLDCVEAVFGYRPNSWEKPDGMLYTEIGRFKAISFLRRLGVVGYSEDKIVPECVRRSPFRFVREYIRAYFEGDGGVKDVTEKQTIACASKSDILLKETQLILLNAGVVSSKYPPYRGKVCGTLQVRSEYVDTYAEMFGFVSERKRAILCSRTPTRKTHAGERIPYLKEALDSFRRAHFPHRSSWDFEKVDIGLEKEKYSAKEVAVLLGCDVSTVRYHVKKGRLQYSGEIPGAGGRFGTKLISKKTLQEFLTSFGRGVRRTVPGRDAWGMTYSKLEGQDLSFIRERDAQLAGRIEELAELRYFWDEIVEVELFEYTVPMGDLTVAEDSSFTADGLICHNSGSNVSLRMLENMFLGYMVDHLHLVNWIVKSIASYMDWEPIKVSFKPFKMADDLQRKAYNFQLNQAGKISDSTLLSDSDFDPSREDELIKTETNKRAEAQKKAQLAQAEIQGESQMIMMRYQLKAQQEQMQMQAAAAPAPGEPGAEAEGVQPGGASTPAMEGQVPQGGAPLPQQAMPPQAMPPIAEQARAELPPAMTATQSPLQLAQQAPQEGEAGAVNVDLLAQAQYVAQYLSQLDENSQTMALMNLRQQSPEFYQVVLGLMQNMSQGSPEAAAAEPLPEQRAPRRGPEAAQV